MVKLTVQTTYYVRLEWKSCDTSKIENIPKVKQVIYYQDSRKPREIIVEILKF